MSEPTSQEPINSLIQLILHADGRHISSATPMIDGPAVTGLLTILHDRGYSEEDARSALWAYGVDEAFEALASIADELEKALDIAPREVCPECLEFLDDVEQGCDTCKERKPPITKEEKGVRRRNLGALETTTLVITHARDEEGGIIAALDGAIETLDHVIEWEWR